MKTSKVAALMLAVAAIAMSVAPAHAARSARYVAGFISDVSPVETVCQNDPSNPTGVGIGGACFSVTPGTTYAVSVADDVQSVVGYYWGFIDRWGNQTFGKSGPDPVGEIADPCTSCSFACGAVVHVMAPPGAVSLRVSPDGFVIGPVDCGLQSPTITTGNGTNGTITVTP